MTLPHCVHQLQPGQLVGCSRMGLSKVVEEVPMWKFTKTDASFEMKHFSDAWFGTAVVGATVVGAAVVQGLMQRLQLEILYEYGVGVDWGQSPCQCVLFIRKNLPTLSIDDMMKNHVDGLIKIPVNHDCIVKQGTTHLRVELMKDETSINVKNVGFGNIPAGYSLPLTINDADKLLVKCGNPGDPSVTPFAWDLREKNTLATSTTLASSTFTDFEEHDRPPSIASGTNVDHDDAQPDHPGILLFVQVYTSTSKKALEFISHSVHTEHTHIQTAKSKSIAIDYNSFDSQLNFSLDLKKVAKTTQHRPLLALLRTWRRSRSRLWR